MYVDLTPLSDSLERGWGEFETNKPELFNLVRLIFRMVDFSELTHPLRNYALFTALLIINKQTVPWKH